MIFEKLVAVLADHVDCDPSSVTMDTTFEELGVDSLDTVDMVMELEEELGIELELDEKISTGHARALLAVGDKEQQYNLANKIFDEKLSVRETERLMKNLQKEKKDKKDQKTENEFIYKGIEEKIKMILGTKVTVNHKKNNKGRIEIEYYSNEELERIMDLLESIHQEA